MIYANHKRCPNRGVALIFALIAIGILTIMAVSSMQRTNVDTSLAGQWKRRALSSEVAETGLLRVARQVRDLYASSHSINSLLGTIQSGTTSGGQYSVSIADNNNVGGVNQDGDGSAITDSDHIFRLRSTGKVGSAEQVIETYYRINPSNTISAPPPPSSCGTATNCNSAALFCGVAADVQRTGSAVISGADHNVPTYGCTGSSCNMPELSGTSSNWSVIGESTLSVSSGVTKYDNAGSSTNCNNWQTFYDTYKNVDRTAPNVVVMNGSSYSTSNDCTNPKVFIIDTTSDTLSVNGHTWLCGIFIVVSNTAIDMGGTVTLNGLVIQMSNSSSLSYSAASGTSNTFGQIITRSTVADSGIELVVKGNPNIYYSTQAVNYGMSALNTAYSSSSSTGAETIAWRTYTQ